MKSQVVFELAIAPFVMGVTCESAEEAYKGEFRESYLSSPSSPIFPMMESREGLDESLRPI